jgi:uroporphyrin-III C-methyltransferase
MAKIKRKCKGFVWLVGAGPGDASLLTLRAKECLKRADVVIYDRLVAPSILSFARPDAELIYAGKEPNGEKTSQAWINETMIAKAREGKKVVRLKNGDPFVFGRGAEEAEALADAGVPFEIVPGVSSAFAVPAYAGIPLTDRRFASSFAVGVGRSAEGENNSVDFRKLADADTVVALMAVGELEKVVAQLVEGGKSPETPAALIEWGATPKQRVAIAQLKDLSSVARSENIRPPAVLVVGEVVKFRDKLAWYERKPLFGKRVLLPCFDTESELASDLEELGAEVVRLPVAITVRQKNRVRLQKAIDKTLAGIFLENVQTATASFGHMNCHVFGLGATMFGGNGDGEQKSPPPKWNGEESGLAAGLKLMVEGISVSNSAPRRLPESFLKAVLKEPIHIVAFTSPSLVQAFFEAVGHERAEEILESAQIVVASARAAKFCRQIGLEPSFVLKPHTFGRLAIVPTK